MSRLPQIVAGRSKESALGGVRRGQRCVELSQPRLLEFGRTPLLQGLIALPFGALQLGLNLERKAACAGTLPHQLFILGESDLLMLEGRPKIAQRFVGESRSIVKTHQVVRGHIVTLHRRVVMQLRAQRLRPAVFAKPIPYFCLHD